MYTIVVGQNLGTQRTADLFKGASLINRQRASARDRLIFHHIFNWTNLSSKKQIDLLELKWLFSRFAIEEIDVFRFDFIETSVYGRPASKNRFEATSGSHK